MPAAGFIDGPINVFDPNSPAATAAQKTAAYLRGRYADYDVSTAGAVPLNPAPGFFLLDEDVRRNRRVFAHCHDQSSLNPTDEISFETACYETAKQVNRPQDVVYVGTRYLEIEELVTPHAN